MSDMDSGHRQLLLVDDDPLVIKVYAERMRYEGWTVAVARDGWEACQEASRKQFDMILLDIRMPFHDGVEVMKEIREGELNAETPTYILTGLAEGEDVDDAMRLGADGVFYKSGTRPDELVEQIKAILAGAPARAELQEAAVGAGAPTGGGGGGASADLVDPAPTPAEPEAATRPPPPPLEGTFDVFVNPFLGDGAVLCRALGFEDSYICPDCGGQVKLTLAASPSGGPGEVIGVFICGRCSE